MFETQDVVMHPWPVEPGWGDRILHWFQNGGPFTAFGRHMYLEVMRAKKLDRVPGQKKIRYGLELVPGGLFPLDARRPADSLPKSSNPLFYLIASHVEGKAATTFLRLRRGVKNVSLFNGAEHYEAQIEDLAVDGPGEYFSLQWVGGDYRLVKLGNDDSPDTESPASFHF